MAIGATPFDVVRQILGHTLRLTVIGIAVGTVGSWMLARGLEGLLFQVSASDPQSFAGMLLILTFVAAIAGYLPARRAARIDPMVALRSE